MIFCIKHTLFSCFFLLFILYSADFICQYYFPYSQKLIKSKLFLIF
ncbi:hypothetical protein ANACOL_03268 [Anaerotruncus colihominis DSM 17241]|uniref:Uncharacterized protein n=1 Tax=Anaerotruncus colihominis DSM 17241 TaxID=445972 RepID=B0PEP0_9FIRM|nr:hypothetical protein ANACOL_03268 [Anaerotruncus colihominis DSM 17241]